MMKFPEGHPRPYIRDGVSGLPMEEQRKILTDAGVPMSQLFLDKLSRRQVQARNPADLKDRADMVRPTTRVSRTEVIYVAEFRVLGWTMPDIADTLARAARRRASIFSIKAERHLVITESDAAMMDALIEIDAERRKAAYEVTLAGNRAITQRRRNNAWERIRKVAEPLWAAPLNDPEWMTADAIAFKVGLSVRTLHTRLGTREDARARAEGRRKK